MATTEITPTDSLKRMLRDTNNAFLSDDEYEHIMDGNCAAEATYQAVRRSDGVWAVPDMPLALHNASFSEEPGASYRLCSGGGGIFGAVSIRLTAGADTREVIEITGCALDLKGLAAEVLEHIATHRAQEYSQSIGGGSVSPETARDELLKQASVLRGVCAI
jgi:hypothetical protein